MFSLFYTIPNLQQVRFFAVSICYSTPFRYHYSVAIVENEPIHAVVYSNSVFINANLLDVPGYEALQLANNINDLRAKIEVIPLLSQALLLISR